MEEYILKRAKALAPSEDQVVYYYNELMSMYQKGIDAGTSTDAKSAWWYGVKAGILRCMYIQSDAPDHCGRLVVGGPVPRRLRDVMQEINQEMEEALKS
jgi:membrane carboxypeptidase/penicillin-binding protein